MSSSMTATSTSGAMPQVILPSWGETVSGFCNSKPVKMAKILRDCARWGEYFQDTGSLGGDRVVNLGSLSSGLKAGCRAFALVDVIPNVTDLTKDVKKAYEAGSEWRAGNRTGLQVTTAALDVAKNTAALTESTIKSAKFLDGIGAISLGESGSILGKVKDVAGMYSCGHGMIEKASSLHAAYQADSWTRSDTLSAHNKMLDIVKFVSGFALNLLSLLSAVAGVVTANPILIGLSSIGLSTSFVKFVNDQEVAAIREASV